MSHTHSSSDNSTLVDIPVSIDARFTGNVAPLMHEIRHALQDLYDDNKTHVIDLRSLPMAPGEEDTIIEMLGHGEVQCQLSSLGLSEIYETRYAGVWLLTHYNYSHEITGRFIEVTRLPEILKSQSQDILDSVEQLTNELHTNASTAERRSPDDE